MNIRLGEKIRELRKARDISQEVLAQYLGVSFQAVSKWETGAAMPDVALIPAIASFFGVSTDELFDYNRLENERRVMQICYAAYEYRVSDPKKSEEMLREGLKQFPGNDVILNNILCVLDPDTRSDEIITICKTLIEGTRDDSVKYDALRILADTYHRTGQQALVGPTLEMIPEIYFSKLGEMACLMEGERSLQAARKNTGVCFEQLVLMLAIMCERYRRSGDISESVRYAILRDGIIELFRQNGVFDLESNELTEWLDEIISRLE